MQSLQQSDIVHGHAYTRIDEGGCGSRAVRGGARCTPPAEATQTAVALPPQSASDCTDKIPVVAASDAAAQSDLYSAVTLAGVIDTDCIVLAGPRNQPMPADQQARLAAAAAGGYIVGGETAVPAAKLAGRTMTRLAGADRWATAALVGNEATNIANGNPTPPTKQAGGDTAEARIIHGPGRVACALHTDGSTECILAQGVGPPEARFELPRVAGSTLQIAGEFPCELQRDGALTCWSLNVDWVAEQDKYEARLDIAITPEGDFASVHTGPDNPYRGPGYRGPGSSICGIRSDRSLTCWNRGASGAFEVAVDTPSGRFLTLTSTTDAACGLRTDRTVVCWGRAGEALVTNDPPTGTFASIEPTPPRSGFMCGLRTDRTIACWGEARSAAVSNTPSGTFESMAVSSGPSSSVCGLRSSGVVSCDRVDEKGGDFFANSIAESVSPPLTALSTSRSGHKLCALNSAGAFKCWDDYGSGG